MKNAVFKSMKKKGIAYLLLVLSLLTLFFGCMKATPKAEPPLPAVQPGEMLFDFYGRDDISGFASNFYDDPPKKAVVFMDSWNKTEAELTDRDCIAAVFEAMKKVRVGDLVDRYVTDSDNDIAFIMADGREFRFDFNRYNLEYDGVVYSISDDDSLWEVLRGILEM